MLKLAVSYVPKRRLSGTLSDRLKSLLAEQKRSVTWLAGEIGQHRVSTSRIVNGQATDLPLSTLRKIAAALGVSVGDLVDEGESAE
ncbi:MAG: Cro/C1-type DNA-binding domain [Gemmataceae bacterium]|nr:Cro/C1-type DNA-binding domain [Gemmataceae bacterium]